MASRTRTENKSRKQRKPRRETMSAAIYNMKVVSGEIEGEVEFTEPKPIPASWLYPGGGRTSGGPGIERRQKKSPVPEPRAYGSDRPLPECECDMKKK